MADNLIRVEVHGLKELERALSRFPRESKKYLAQAGNEAATRVVLQTQGLKKYPPATDANSPPVPYYIRGRGMQYKSGNTGKSERLGTQFYVESKDYKTAIGNRASYAKYVVGDDQAHFMKPKGWRTLRDVVNEKMPDIVKVYDAWVEKLLRGIGLK